MSFENINIPDVKSAFTRAKEALGRFSFDVRNFIGVGGHTESSIADDEKRVERLGKKFSERDTAADQEQKEVATILEAIFHEHIELSDWLGGETRTVSAHPFDDYVNGVDTIAVISRRAKDEIVDQKDKEDNPVYLALAMDVTFGHSYKTLLKKFLKIKEEIEKGTLGQVKYFHLPAEGGSEEVFDSRSLLPHVIVGVDNSTVNRLSRLWLGDEQKKLGADRVQFQILHELMIELLTFRSYARKIGQTAVAGVLGHAYETIKAIYNKKIASGGRDPGGRDDVFHQVEKFCEDFSSLKPEEERPPEKGKGLGNRLTFPPSGRRL